MAIIGTRTTPRADLAEALLDFNPEGYQFIAEQVLPVRNVSKRTANYTIISAENNMGNDDKAAKGSELNKITMSTEEATYTCKRRGLAMDVLNEDIDEYSDVFNAEVQASRLVRYNILVNKEIRVAAAAFNTTTFATGNSNFTDYSSAPWSTTTTDIVAQLKAAKVALWANCGFEPDSMAISYETFQNMLINDSIKELIKDGTLTKANITAVLGPVVGVENIYVGRGQVNTADEGQTYSGSAIWAKTYALVYKSAQANMAMPGLGWSFNWTGNGNVTLGPSSYTVPQIDGSVVQEVEYRDEKIHDTGRYGYLLQVES